MNGNDAIYPMATEGDGFNDGLTKRELIAAMAMQGLLACPSYIQTVEVLASTSIKAADALIARLSADPVEGASDE
jgi:galactose-1-phosphate uridylyltransferase